MHIKQQRQCIACKKIDNQNNMIRVVKFNNLIAVEKKHSSNGRGAYICNSAECVNLVIKKHLLNRAFKTNLDNSVYQQLGEYEQNN